MKKRAIPLILPIVAGLALTPFGAAAMAAHASVSSTEAALTTGAISPEPASARAAIAALRKQGAAGLQALFAAYDTDIERHEARCSGSAIAPLGDADSKWQRIAAALDGVAMQKDSWASRLYWYTDLAEAKRAALASGKPILSLRLLGNLNEELSCANSRFFRTALYPNREISEYLRAHYILHWKSVRPVPTFTLDFGDGRKIVRTLTGNSIHYVLDAHGRPVDALPGLCGPQAFLRHLTEDESVARQSGSLADDAAERRFVAKWHQAQFDALALAWKADCAKAYGKAQAPTLAVLIAPIGNPTVDGSAPSAIVAAPLAIGKAVVERPIVSAISGAGNTWAVGATALDWAWDQIAQLHGGDAVLDPGSRALVADKHPDLTRVPMMARVASRFGGGFGDRFGSQAKPTAVCATPDAAFSTLIANFERSMAQDSARNEYVFHARLHQWFADGLADNDVESLNRRVYADLFLTPESDPWLGLAPAGAYSGLSNDGLVGNVPPAPEKSSASPAIVANRGIR